MSGATPTGWYADPSGQARLRWWDGQAWTQHTSAGADAEVAPAAAPSDAVEEGGGEDDLADRQRGGCDVEVPLGVGRKKRLIVNDVELHWGKEAVRLDAVQGLSYQVVRQSMNGVPTNTTYTVIVYTATGKMKMAITTASFSRKATKSGAGDAFGALVGMLGERVEPRLVTALADRVARGEVLEVGGLRISRDGLVQHAALRGDKQAPWASYVSARFARGFVTVFVAEPGQEKAKALGAVSMGTRDAVLLPVLLRVLADTYAG